MTKEDHGKAIEDIVEQICKIAFLDDLVVRSPTFQKSGGRMKEAADFLVPFKNALLAFQVKSRTELKPGNEKSGVDYGRIQKSIKKGIGQLKTIRRAVNAKQLSELKNARGISIPFDPRHASRIVGVVLIDLIGEEKFSIDERTAIYNGYVFDHNMPVHIFRRQDFEVITSEVDTLPDFVRYLDTRQVFFEKKILGPMTDELDFLAVYKVNPDLIEQCLEGHCDLLVVEDGLWESYQTKHEDRIRRRDFLNRPSLIVDKIIDNLHTAIEYDPGVAIPGARNDAQQGSVDNYFAAIIELSTICRLERRAIGQKFLERMRKADLTGHGHSLILNTKEQSAVLVLSTSHSRQERTNGLFNLAAVAYCALKLKKIIGIVSEPLSAKMRSYDVIFLENVGFGNCAELAKKFEDCFGPMQNYQDFEYGSAVKNKPET